MTTGEMRAWLHRLNNILEVGGPLKKTRLQSLKTDLSLATDLLNDEYAIKLYSRVCEELTTKRTLAYQGG